MDASLYQVKRALKTVTKQIKEQAQEFISNDSPLEKVVKDATANTNWGCAVSVLHDISRASFDYHDYNVIMSLIWHQLAAKAKYWRRIYKHLTLHGPERVVDDVKDNSGRLRNLSGFQFTEEGKDRGVGIRQKAKTLIDMVSDVRVIRAEREKARNMRSRYVGFGAHGELSVAVAGYEGTNTAARNTMARFEQEEQAKEARRAAAARDKARELREKRRAARSQNTMSRSNSATSSASHTSELSSSSEDVKAKRKSKRKGKRPESVDAFNTAASWNVSDPCLLAPAAPAPSFAIGSTVSSSTNSFPGNVAGFALNEPKPLYATAAGSMVLPDPSLLAANSGTFENHYHNSNAFQSRFPVSVPQSDIFSIAPGAGTASADPPGPAGNKPANTIDTLMFRNLSNLQTLGPAQNSGPTKNPFLSAT